MGNSIIYLNEKLRFIYRQISCNNVTLSDFFYLTFSRKGYHSRVSTQWCIFFQCYFFRSERPFLSKSSFTKKLFLFRFIKLTVNKTEPDKTDQHVYKSSAAMIFLAGCYGIYTWSLDGVDSVNTIVNKQFNIFLSLKHHWTKDLIYVNRVFYFKKSILSSFLFKSVYPI